MVEHFRYKRDKNAKNEMFIFTKFLKFNLKKMFSSLKVLFFKIQSNHFFKELFKCSM